MKKFLALFLALIMILAISACNSSSDNVYDEDDKKDNLKNTEDSDNKGENNSVNMNSISDATGYYSGVMRVKNSIMERPYFINKKGECVLSWPQATDNKDYIPGMSERFYGKYFPISEYDLITRQSMDVLLSETGKITHPSDVGVTDFLIMKSEATKKMAEDGYILAKTVKASYTSSVTTLVVFDNNFNKLCELEEINYTELSQYKYLSGFLYNDNKGVDVRNGKVYTNLADMFSQITLIHNRLLNENPLQ